MRVDRTFLISQLETGKRFSGSRNLPILDTVLLQMTPKLLRGWTTDLESSYVWGIRNKEEPSDEDNGSVCIDLKMLLSILKAQSKTLQDVSLRILEGYRLQVNGSTTLPGLCPEDWPTRPTPPKDAVWCDVLNINDIIKLKDIPAKEDEGSWCHCLRFNFPDREVVATDRNRLYIAKLRETPFKTYSVPLSIIKHLTVKAVAKQVTPKITVIDENMFIKMKHGLLAARLLDSGYPDYRAAIPERMTRTLKVADKDEFMAKLKEASIMSAAVRLTLTQKGVEIVAYDPECGDFNATITEGITYTGEPLTVGFNPDYFLAALKVMETSQVEISFAGDDVPCLMQDGTLEVAVMPRRL